MMPNLNDTPPGEEHTPPGDEQDPPGELDPVEAYRRAVGKDSRNPYTYDEATGRYAYHGDPDHPLALIRSHNRRVYGIR